VSLFLISLAVGALLGDSFFHLLPESLELSSPVPVLNSALLGILLFFLFERLAIWRHCHELDCPESDEHSPASGAPTVNFIGDLVHNFFDGLIIAASFSVSFPLGLATSLAVVFHEIPQEIGDSAIFLHYGYSKRKTAYLGLISSLSALLAVVLFFGFGLSKSLPPWIISLIAGGFIYLASSDLIPELHRHHPSPRHTLIQIFGIALGLGSMYLLTVLG